MFISRPIKFILLPILLLPLPFITYAKEAAPLAKNPELEQRVDNVTSELRCLVCQNQTIADSHADLAIDLKNQVRDMMANGKTKDDVINYMGQRYGDFVRYRPPMKPTTYLLWFGPFLLLVTGGVVLITSLKRRSKRLAGTVPLSEEESKKLESLLQSTEDKRL